MNIAELQQLAEDRVLDAEALLMAQRWSGAYYLAGYAIECGLKVCVLGHVLRTGIIFSDKKDAEKCWTHDLEALVKLADLDNTLGLDLSANPALESNWLIVADWSEASRYEQTTQLEAEALYYAVSDAANGILPWIRRRW